MFQRLKLAVALGEGLLATMIAAAFPTNEPLSLIRTGHSWSYYLATNAPPTNWFETDFDDETWTERPSGFSSAPTFGSLEATLWPPAIEYRSAFLRTRFPLENPSNVEWLILRIDYSDGFMAYLNGQEIARRGLTNDPVAWDDRPDYHPGGAAEEIDITGAAGLLREGENVLAIQVHNATNNTPALPSSYALRILPELLANFTRGPYIQNLTTNSVQIIWRTPVPADSSVEFGLDQALGWIAPASTSGATHVATLTNLLPGTRYCYRVNSSSDTTVVTSPMSSFRTFATAGPVTFHVIGDTGGQVVQQPSGIVPQYQLAKLMSEKSADLVLHCGDVIYPHFSPGREDTHFLSVYQPLLRTIPMFATMGNHDFDPVVNSQIYLDTFFLPTNSATGTEHFYSFDHGDVHFVSLFVPDLSWGSESSGELSEYALTNGSVQYNWLTNDLAGSEKGWKILLLHTPVNGSGNHRFDDADSNGRFDRFELLELLLPVASRYGVQVLFSGHDHAYETFMPTNGVYAVISGGGGGPLPQYFFPRNPGSTRRDAGSRQFFLNWHFLTVTIEADTLRLEATGTNGMVFDALTIRRTPPPTPFLHEASWHTPLVETIPANDGRGNIVGQTFDLIGTPLLTAGGDFSNLGRGFVNNDATNVYIGFEQFMLYENNNVFLFIETPHLVGVSNLGGLGDGLIATDQGVEGLDFLENLAFTDFTPCIAVLFGDEYADATDRMFSRPDLALTNVGQGIFRLDPDFTTVAGAAMQQFNRSPQQLEPPFQLLYPERNANFVETSIPLAELGHVRSGDIIRIGAVVGGPSYDAQLQSRQLDTSFLGTSMTGAGLSNTVLAGISVRLALDPSGDEDSDGMSNGWELAHGLDPYDADGCEGAKGDPDKDGMSNLAEFIAGTDPRDPTSVLRLRVEDFAPEQVLLSWSAVIGRQYHLEISPGSSGWIDHPNPVFPRTASSNAETFLDSFTNLIPPIRFYRIRIEP